MQAEPLVSIVIPVYNKQPYLSKCLQSVFNQTWRNIEIIVVDDASTDGSRKLLQEMCDQNSKATIIHIEHSGPSAARNTGLRSSSGEYVTFVDADDWIEPDYVEKMVRNIGDADICITGCRLWEQRNDRWETEKNRCDSGRYSRAEYLQLLTKQHRYISGIGWKLYRKSLLNSNNIVFKMITDHAEDTIFFYDVLLYFSAAVCINETGYVIRKHDLNSLTRQKESGTDKLRIILNEYGKIRSVATEEALALSILRQQITTLGYVGRVCCYQMETMEERQEAFFSIADEFQIRDTKKLGRPMTKNEALVRLALKTRSFFLFYAITKVIFRYKEDKRFVYEE